MNIYSFSNFLFFIWRRWKRAWGAEEYKIWIWRRWRRAWAFVPSMKILKLSRRFALSLFLSCAFTHPHSLACIIVRSLCSDYPGACMWWRSVRAFFISSKMQVFMGRQKQGPWIQDLSLAWYNRTLRWYFFWQSMNNLSVWATFSLIHRFVAGANRKGLTASRLHRILPQHILTSRAWRPSGARHEVSWQVEDLGRSPSCNYLSLLYMAWQFEANTVVND